MSTEQTKTMMDHHPEALAAEVRDDTERGELMVAVQTVARHFG